MTSGGRLGDGLTLPSNSVRSMATLWPMVTSGTLELVMVRGVQQTSVQ